MTSRRRKLQRAGVRHGGRWISFSDGKIRYGLRHRPMSRVDRLALFARMHRAEPGKWRIRAPN